jgi:hypothetical protein
LGLKSKRLKPEDVAVDVTADGTLGLSTEQLKLMKKIERMELRRRAGILPSAPSTTLKHTSAEEENARDGAKEGFRDPVPQDVIELDEALDEALLRVNAEEEEDSSWMTDESASARTREQQWGSGEGRGGSGGGGRGGGRPAQIRPLVAEMGANRRARESNAEGGRDEGVGQPVDGAEWLDDELDEVYEESVCVGGAWWDRCKDEGLRKFMTDSEFPTQQVSVFCTLVPALLVQKYKY